MHFEDLTLVLRYFQTKSSWSLTSLDIHLCVQPGEQITFMPEELKNMLCSLFSC